MQWTLRPPVPDDAPSIVELVNVCTRAEVDMAVYEPGDLGHDWAGRSDQLLVATDDAGTIVGYLETEHEGNDLFFEVFVGPSRRGAGIGPLLVAAAERMATDRRTRTISTNVGREEAVRFLEGRGYLLIASEYAMFLDLDDRPRLSVPDGIQIRSFVHGVDEAAMHRAIRDSFGDDWPDSSSDLEGWMRSHQSVTSYDPDLWLFAVAGDEIVGAVMNRTQWHAQADTGWIKNLGVVPAWRGRGVGRALVMESARRFYDRGKRRLVLGVYADNPTRAPDFYRRIGLRVGGRSWDLQRSAASSGFVRE